MENITFGEIEDLIKGTLFENKEEPDMLYQDRFKEEVILTDEFPFKRGDEWKTKEGRFIFQEDKDFTSSRKIKLVVCKDDYIPINLQFRPYGKLRAELKDRLLPSKLVYKLTECVNAYFIIPKMMEEQINLMPHRKNKIKKNFEALFGKEKYRKKELTESLYSILTDHTKEIGEELRMGLYYIARIFQACGIETGSENEILNRLYRRCLREFRA